MCRAMPWLVTTTLCLAAALSSASSTCDDAGDNDEVCEMKTSLLQVRKIQKKSHAAAVKDTAAADEQNTDERTLLTKKRQDPCGMPGQEAACNQQLNEEIAKMNSDFETSKNLLNEANHDVGMVNGILGSHLTTTNFPWNHAGQGDIAPLAPMPAMPSGGNTGMGGFGEGGFGGAGEGFNNEGLGGLGGGAGGFEGGAFGGGGMGGMPSEEGMGGMPSEGGMGGW